MHRRHQNISTSERSEYNSTKHNKTQQEKGEPPPPLSLPPRELVNGGSLRFTFFRPLCALVSLVVRPEPLSNWCLVKVLRYLVSPSFASPSFASSLARGLFLTTSLSRVNNYKRERREGGRLKLGHQEQCARTVVTYSTIFPFLPTKPRQIAGRQAGRQGHVVMTLYSSSAEVLIE